MVLFSISQNNNNLLLLRVSEKCINDDTSQLTLVSMFLERLVHGGSLCPRGLMYIESKQLAL